MESSSGDAANPYHPGEPNHLIFKMGVDYLESAKQYENQGKILHAFKMYKESSNKFLFILKNGETDARRV